MSSTVSDNSNVMDEIDDSGNAAYDEYRVLSVLAVASVLIAIISLPALFFVKLCFLPVTGLVLGFKAIREISARPGELTGLGLARAGLFLSAAIFLGSIAIATTIYLTEVPEGYERISFIDMQPDDAHPELPVPPYAIERNGQKVFVKGYVYPDDTKSELHRFVLVPDMGTCCFGGQPALTDMIEVTLKDPLRLKYSLKRRRLGGILKVDTRKKPVSGLGGVYYQLDADYVK